MSTAVGNNYTEVSFETIQWSLKILQWIILWWGLEQQSDNDNKTLIIFSALTLFCISFSLNEISCVYFQSTNFER